MLESIVLLVLLNNSISFIVVFYSGLLAKGRAFIILWDARHLLSIQWLLKSLCAK